MATSVIMDKKLDIFNIPSIEGQLTPLLNAGDLTLNLSQIERCDYIGIQMLLSFVKTVKKNGYTVLIEEPGSVFTDALTVLGLEDEFNVMDNNHG